MVLKLEWPEAIYKIVHYYNEHWTGRHFRNFSTIASIPHLTYLSTKVLPTTISPFINSVMNWLSYLHCFCSSTSLQCTNEDIFINMCRLSLMQAIVSHLFTWELFHSFPNMLMQHHEKTSVKSTPQQHNPWLFKLHSSVGRKNVTSRSITLWCLRNLFIHSILFGPCLTLLFVATTHPNNCSHAYYYLPLCVNSFSKLYSNSEEYIVAMYNLTCC